MDNSHDNKSAPNLQVPTDSHFAGINSLPTGYQLTANQLPGQLVPTDYQLIPRTYEGKFYYATVDVAKIIGVIILQNAAHFATMLLDTEVF